MGPLEFWQRRAGFGTAGGDIGVAEKTSFCPRRVRKDLPIGNVMRVSCVNDQDDPRVERLVSGGELIGELLLSINGKGICRSPF